MGFKFKITWVRRAFSYLEQIPNAFSVWHSPAQALQISRLFTPSDRKLFTGGHKSMLYLVSFLFRAHDVNLYKKNIFEKCKHTRRHRSNVAHYFKKECNDIWTSLLEQGSLNPKLRNHSRWFCNGFHLGSLDLTKGTQNRQIVGKKPIWLIFKIYLSLFIIL